MISSALQTFWTQIRPTKIRDLIRIQTVWCFDRIPEKSFLEKWFLKEKGRQLKHSNNPVFAKSTCICIVLCHNFYLSDYHFHKTEQILENSYQVEFIRSNPTKWLASLTDSDQPVHWSMQTAKTLTIQCLYPGWSESHLFVHESANSSQNPWSLDTLATHYVAVKTLIWL